MNVKVLQPVGHWALIALVGLFILSCKKDAPEPKPEPEPVDRTEGQLIKDDIYKYYKLYSIWADEVIPDYLQNPAEFTDKYRSADEVLAALKKLTPVHTAYDGGVLDRFSFADGMNGYNTSEQASVKMDNNEGYGLSIQWFSVDDGATAQPYISFAEGGSPGQVAGFRRADIITAVNNDKEDYSVRVTCSGIHCNVNKEDIAKFDRLNNNLDAGLDASNLTLQVRRPDNKLFTNSMYYSNSYPINPIYKDTIYSSEGNNVGYLALSSFEEVDNGSLNKKNMDLVFEKFQDKQIKSLVVDLRYNGGGYVDAAIYVADKIGGAKTKGKLMLTYEMNKYMQSVEAAELRRNLAMQDTYFKGLSLLDLNKVYFLVSEETASAAEMLINVLVPQTGLAVEIIATGTRTYGKPVGFFEQVIKDKVSYWPASFILKNARGNVGEKYNKGNGRNLRDYWDGLIPDKENLGDDVSSQVGDPRDPMLATALSEAMPTSRTSARASVRTISARGHGMVSQGKINTRPDRGMIKKFKE